MHLSSVLVLWLNLAMLRDSDEMVADPSPDQELPRTGRARDSRSDLDYYPLPASHMFLSSG